MKNSKKNRKMVNMALAVLLAFGLWFYVINVENPTGSANLRDLPVELQGEFQLAKAGLMVTDLSKETMNVKVTGRKKTLMKLDKKNVSLAVDVSSITGEGEHDLICKATFPSHISTDNVTVSSWNEMKVTVTVEKKGTKTIQVRGEFIGTEAEGCLAGTVTTDPGELELTGPEDSLARIDHAQVQMGGESVSDTIVEQAPVVFMDKNGVPVEDLENITSSATEVEITVPVRRVVNIPLTVAFQDGGGATGQDVTYEITPASVTVTAENREKLPASISLGEIDLSQVYGDTSYSMPIRLPHGITPWGASGYASVSVSLDKLASRQIATGNINLTNVPEGYAASLVSPKLYVWVRGTPSQVSKLTADEIAVEVDLSGASLGDELQRLPATVSLVEGDLKDMGIVGTRYSVALRLTPSS